ncbi:2OG-Fe(II) oxygenase, partial [Paraglaciecola sp.]|uniref:2OG-Fe(II) oxygenase n=1 Tax=Paraglaciecola sp. TaxID=1920173 RepID=UPI003EF11D22
FKGRSNRALSTVYYLNPNWSEADGGELIIYSPEKNDEPISKVTPLFNQCIIFLSDMFPHEVLASNKDRFSIAGWFRVNGTTQQHLDPSN